MGWFSNLLGTTLSTFGIGPKGTRSTLDATGLTADRSCALPDASGTLALIINSIAAGNLVAAPSSDAVASSLATKASDSLVVHLAGTEAITGQKKFQVGSTSGCAIFGADVNATTVSANVRKIARVTCPTYDATSNAVLLFAGDMTGGTQNVVYFGGVPGGSGNTAATNLVFCTESAVNIAGGTARWEIVTSGALRPFADNTYTLGDSSRRPSVLWAASGTISTSDSREKTEPRDLTPTELACAIDLARLPCVYQWLAAIEEKGGDARLHCGPTVQAVMTCMESHGIDPFRWGFVCYDEWDETPEAVESWDAEHDEEGNLIREAGSEVMQEYSPAGDRYSLRSSELGHFIMRGIVASQDAMNARIAALEA